MHHTIPQADDARIWRTVVVSTLFEAALRVRSFAPSLVDSTASSILLALPPTREGAKGWSRVADSKTTEGTADCSMGRLSLRT